MNTQFPIPSFDDIRRILQFWIDQQDRWFYFEGAASQSGSIGEAHAPNPLHSRTMVDTSTQKQTIYYLQPRIVGKIGDVISYPPSLLLLEAQVMTAHLSYQYGLQTSIVSREVRPKYGLVFTQITYYEPVEDHLRFLAEDPRVAAKG
jgi:hypothetical protein